MSDTVTAEVETPATLTTAAIVSNFIAGATEGVNTEVTISGNVLYYNSTPVARRAEDLVLLSNNNISNIELSDALIGGLARAGRRFRRISDFTNLTDSSSRVNDLDKGKLDDFRDIAKTFGLAFTEDEVNALDVAKNFRLRVATFYTKLAEDERKARLTAEEASREERIAAQSSAWDRGEGPAQNYQIKGADGSGLRMRLKKGAAKPTLETSNGNVSGLAVAKRAWEFASTYWHGGKVFPYAQRATKYIHSSRQVTVESSSIKFGCQSATRKEVERFAALMGWERAKKA